MSSFVVYHTPNTGPGYFLTGDQAEGFGGTYRLTDDRGTQLRTLYRRPGVRSLRWPRC